MLKLLGAFLAHGWQLLLLRHDGAGLPTQRNAVVWLAMGFTALTRLMAELLAPDPFDPVVYLGSSVIFFAMLLVLLRPLPMVALMLITSTGHLIRSVWYLIVPQDPDPQVMGYASAVLMGWELLAIVRLSIKYVQSQQKKKK